MASKALARAQRHFKYVAGLRDAKAPASMVRATANVWTKRKPKSSSGFHKAPKPGAVTVTKGAHHVGS